MSFRPASGSPFSLAGTPGLDLVDWRTGTLASLLQRRAAAEPHLVLYTYLEDGESKEVSMNAAALDMSARQTGHALSKFAKPGERAILLFGDGLDYISGLFGCFSAGLVAVSGVHPSAPRADERLLGIIRDSQATLILGQARILAEFQRALDDVLDEIDLRWVATDTLKPDGAGMAAWTSVPSRNEDLALIQYTSGSSREPRGVMLTHRNVLHNLNGQMLAFGYCRGDTGVSWLPFSHDMGLIGCVLMAIYGGGRCVLLSPSHFLEDPLRWPRAISRYRASLSGGPSFAYELCAAKAEAGDISTIDLSCWVIAVNGAEPVRADAIRRFTKAFAPCGFQPDAVHPSYGLAEATLLVTNGGRSARFQTRIFDKTGLREHLPVLAEDPSQGTELTACGRPMDGQRVVIVDAKTASHAAPGKIGEIWIAGPSVSSGYFGRDHENALYFGARLNDGSGPYLKTGDLGFWYEDELYVTGRSRDLIIIRGKNYYPQDLEHSAELAHPAIRPGHGACFQHEETGDLIALCEIDRGRHEDAERAGTAIRKAFIRDHGINPHRIVLAAWGSALKTPSGKIQRSQTRRALAEGQIVIVHETVSAVPAAAGTKPASFASVEDWFAAKMTENGVDCTAFDPAMRLTELGFDSLKIIELKADLERDLGLSVNVADLYAFQDIQSLADHLRVLARSRGTPGDAPPEPDIRPAVRNGLAAQRARRGAQTAGGPSSL